MNFDVRHIGIIHTHLKFTFYFQSFQFSITIQKHTDVLHNLNMHAVYNKNTVWQESHIVNKEPKKKMWYAALTHKQQRNDVLTLEL